MIPEAILGVYLHVQLTRIAKSMFLFSMQRFDSGTCIRKHTANECADSLLKALNAKETSMHTRLSLVLYLSVQKASHLRNKILAARNRAALSSANNVLKAHHNDYNNISGVWPGYSFSIKDTSVGRLKK